MSRNRDQTVYRRVVDPREGFLDQVFLGPNEWAVLEGERAVAKLVWLPRQTEPATGVLGKLKKMLSESDMGIVSVGGNHVLPAPVALGMMMLVRELTDRSIGE